jgi:uncharacterized C2H2 Zn-finger protein
MKCPLCERDDIKNVTSLSNHMRSKHPGKYQELGLSRLYNKDNATKQPEMPSAENDSATTLSPASIPTPLTTTEDPLRCPECGRGPFKDERGRASHRRAAHHVIGNSKTAAYSRKVQKSKKKKSDFSCDICGRVLQSQAGKTNHMQKAHPGSSQQALVVSQPTEVKINGVTKRRNVSQAEHLIDSRITPEFVAYAVGKIEGLVERIASENDLPSREFARRCAEYFQLSANR